MSNQQVRLTYEQLSYIIEQTGISDPQSAMVYFAEIMNKENISTHMMPQVVAKLMERQRKQIK